MFSCVPYWKATKPAKVSAVLFEETTSTSLQQFSILLVPYVQPTNPEAPIFSAVTEPAVCKLQMVASSISLNGAAPRKFKLKSPCSGSNDIPSVL